MNPADLTLSISPTLTSRPAPGTLSIAPKAGKAPVPRIDLEPIYTQLKSALGEQWPDYKASINAFVLGNLSQAELSWVLQPLLSAAPSVITSSNSAFSPISTLTLHNTLLAAIYANTLRDPPPTEVAPWVVATDKPTSASKSAGASGANDKAEERLRKEVMSVHARDRRRIKTLKEGGKPVNDGLTEMQDYRNELAVKPPDIAPQSAGGIAKTNWDIEIRRRYAQPLAGETLEFPTLNDMQNRIEPICYEEGLSGGAAQGVLQSCSEMMEEATEVFLKELLGQMYALSRSNGEGCVTTHAFKKQLRKEEHDFDHGTLQLSAAGLLPVEMELQAKREALSMEDMRLAVQLGDTYTKQDPFLSRKVIFNRQPDIQRQAPKVNGIFASSKPTVNGSLTNSERAGLDEVMVDGDNDLPWRGATKSDFNDLMNVLDDCLAIG